MVNEEGVASFMILVSLSSNDHDLVNNFGYRIEEKFREAVRGRIMKALAEMPHLVAIDVNFVQVDEFLPVAELDEEYEDEE